MAKWTMAALAAMAVAAVASACGSSGTKSGFGPGGGGPGGGDDASAGGDDAGFGMFGDSGPGSSSSGGGGPTMPHGCDQSCITAGGMCVNDACVLTDNAGGVDPGTQGSLQGGGSSDGTFAWLYPYDQTVFPRGLLPPTLQLAGVAADAVYVHITSSSLDYKGFFKPAAGPIRVTFSQPVWTAITLAASAKDVLEVQVSKISGGMVSGPATESWSIAQGSLRGTIYYETYGSTLAGGVGSVGIMQIQPGAKQPNVLKTGCGNVCHTASADGSTLVASQSLLSSASYDLKSGAAQINVQGDERFTYGGLFPDGTFGMSATHYRTWLNTPSRLYDTKTGTNIPALGWDSVIKNGGTTAFSPDGKQLAFVHEDKDGGHTIAKMDFTAGNHTFANLIDLATDSGSYVGWPAFTPDGKWVVYHSGTSQAFETDAGNHGDIFIVDVATHTVHRLDALGGYEGSGTQSYLPANDPNLSFAPTVLPEAVGGYFWVVFTSHRAYGNLLPSMAAGTDGTADERGQLWVAALDLNPQPGHDASHPAFYLDGQEIEADNLRGFWVLPPCRQDGNDCTSGDQCCDGFCRSNDGGPAMCVPPPGGCSNEFEKCSTAADCCNKGDQCINGRCASPAPQ